MKVKKIFFILLFFLNISFLYCMEKENDEITCNGDKAITKQIIKNSTTESTHNPLEKKRKQIKLNILKKLHPTQFINGLKVFKKSPYKILEKLLKQEQIIQSLKNEVSRVSLKTLEQEQIIKFLSYEIMKLNEYRRSFLLNNYKNMNFSPKTSDSFDFQWKELNQGKSLLDDKNFNDTLQDLICKYLNVDKNFLKGKKVLDVGAGSGRFTYGFLSMGANVTSIEITKSGCEQIKQSCKEFSENLTILNKDILSDPLPKGFDIVFCYGVVHHTGNTYLAMKRVCETAKPGAKIFFMVYGYPSKYEEFSGINFYEDWKHRLRHKEFSEKVNEIKINFPEELVHGYFDSFSPCENDLLSLEEIINVLHEFEVKKIKKTVNNRNIHIVGEKKY